jgi:hypothetical protein
MVTGFNQHVESMGNASRLLDPDFADASAHDFHLLSYSHAIKTGTTDGAPVGERSPRVKSGTIDLACY